MPNPILSKIFGKKKAPAPAPVAKLGKKPSFNNPTPNIPKNAPAGAKTVPTTAANKAEFTQKVKHASAVSAKQEAARTRKGDTSGSIANQRTQAYMAHNHDQIASANKNGGKMAISRSESGRNHLYHAINPK